MTFSIQLVTLHSEPLRAMTTNNTIDDIQKVWPIFEEQLGSLKGRKMYGLQYGPLGSGTYQCAATLIQGEDQTSSEIIQSPSGLFARIRLKGPSRHEQIGEAFSTIIESYEEECDFTRPTIEFYKDHQTVDVLVPVLANTKEK